MNVSEHFNQRYKCTNCTTQNNMVLWSSLIRPHAEMNESILNPCWRIKALLYCTADGLPAFKHLSAVAPWIHKHWSQAKEKDLLREDRLHFTAQSIAAWKTSLSWRYIQSKGDYGVWDKHINIKGEQEFKEEKKSQQQKTACFDCRQHLTWKYYFPLRSEVNLSLKRIATAI